MANSVALDRALLRSASQDEYAEVAACPWMGFHFHTGRFLDDRLGNPADRVAALPDRVAERFAGVGNPVAWGGLAPGERVVDLGSGAGFDALLAARKVGREGHVLDIDMTPAMVAKARANAEFPGALAGRRAATAPQRHAIGRRGRRAERLALSPRLCQPDLW